MECLRDKCRSINFPIVDVTFSINDRIFNSNNAFAGLVRTALAAGTPRPLILVVRSRITNIDPALNNAGSARIARNPDVVLAPQTPILARTAVPASPPTTPPMAPPTFPARPTSPPVSPDLSNYSESDLPDPDTATLTELYPGQQFEVMLSYEHHSVRKVEIVYNALIDNGHRVWMDTHQINGSIYSAMAEAIDRSRVMVAFLNYEYQASLNCSRELAYADHRNKPIVPVRNFQEPPTEIPQGKAFFKTAGLLYIDLTSIVLGTPEFDHAINKLLEEVQHRING
ncbi:hypothetical protein HK100_002891 [Physocladia obscura]|uniref:TIR domain-containing protein n=1 Tax=Physocladia obscura TaxID=109957 RepID=A0AAD5XLB3_9FUNG|nr:hypothetical protein HK100_002891 [Physocladia obscura]